MDEEQKFDIGGEITTTVSTSRSTASVSPIILEETNFLKLSFNPEIVDNTGAPEKPIKGRLVFQKKGKNDPEFPYDAKLTRGSALKGNHIELQFDTSGTYNLYVGLRELYDLYRNTGGVPQGEQRFVKVDDEFANLYKIIKGNPEATKALSEKKNQELVQLFLDLITRSESIEALKSGLSFLAPENISVLDSFLNIERFSRFIEKIEENLENGEENFWQDTFSKNQWIISQLFSCPYTIFAEKAYLGGKSVFNKGGNICDFIYKNDLTKNVALVEIKTPCTKLIGNKYRNNSYALSEELTGPINQLLSYKDSLLKDYYPLKGETDKHFVAFNPKCVLIVGTINSLDDDMICTLESFRNSLNTVEIIAFDELVLKMAGIRAILMGYSMINEASTFSENKEKPRAEALNSHCENILDDDDMPF